MNAYFYNADIYCKACALAIRKELDDIRGLPGDKPGIGDTGDSETYPQGPHADGGGESHRPEHCRNCGLFLENPLTGEGMAYVSKALYEDPWEMPTLAAEQWAEFYGFPIA